MAQMERRARDYTPVIEPPGVEEVHVLWISEGMSCDGDSVSITAAMQPSIEDVLLGNIPGLPKVHLHNKVLSPTLGGKEFLTPFFQAVNGELGAPFVFVLCAPALFLRRRRRFGFAGAASSPSAGGSPAASCSAACVSGACASPLVFFFRRRRRRERLAVCFGAGRFSESANAASWIVPSCSRAASMSWFARGV